jgi:type VI secretion system protein ImpL
VAKQVAPGSVAPEAYRAAMAAVDQRFQPLRALLGTGGAAPIDQILRPLGDLQQQLAKQFQSAAKTAAPAVGEDPAAALRAEALRQPQPIARWLVAFATGGVALRDGGPRGAMVTAWNASGGGATLCPAVLANHYPFVPTAAADASVADFTRLLGPGGVIDAFFNAQLKPYVDMKTKPWKLQPLEGVSAPVTPADLAQFQRAAEIRDLFFPAGAMQPLVRFEVTPGALDPAATMATLDLGGTPVTAVRGAPARPAVQVWPPHPHPAAAHLGIEVPPPGTPLQIDTDGPWATFRLIARARAATTGDRMALTFSDPNHSAHFELRVRPNPFVSPLLADFRCPTVQ